MRFMMIATAGFLIAAGAAWAQTPAGTTAPPAAPGPSNTVTKSAVGPASPAGGQDSGKAPSALVIYFDTGSAAIHPADRSILNQAARLYRDGNPLVMVVSGATDAVGDPVGNLRLSQVRANAVLRELVARGIPAARFQVLAKGSTDPHVPTPVGVAEAANRRVEISWR
jgi:outer membrane protein OmpA-like peptidoglycan-associated protein